MSNVFLVIENHVIRHATLATMAGVVAGATQCIDNFCLNELKLLIEYYILIFSLKSVLKVIKRHALKL